MQRAIPSQGGALLTDLAHGTAGVHVHHGHQPVAADDKQARARGILASKGEGHAALMSRRTAHEHERLTCDAVVKLVAATSDPIDFCVHRGRADGEQIATSRQAERVHRRRACKLADRPTVEYQAIDAVVGSVAVNG